MRVPRGSVQDGSAPHHQEVPDHQAVRGQGSTSLLTYYIGLAFKLSFGPGKVVCVVCAIYKRFRTLLSLAAGSMLLLSKVLGPPWTPKRRLP